MADNRVVFKSRLEQAVEAKHGKSVEALLRQLYVADGLSQEQVAASLGVSRFAVMRWMSVYGIPTRDRRRVAA